MSAADHPTPPTTARPSGDRTAADGVEAAGTAGRPEEAGPRRSAAASEGQHRQTPGTLERVGELVDRLLVFDVFLVIGAALWFGGAVVLQARGIEAPLQLFQTLWQPLFTPAIGLLMAAALLSGALGWWRRRGQR